LSILATLERANQAPPVLLERRQHLLVITLNRPDQRNALDSRLGAALTAAFQTLEQDAELRVAVLTGAGAGFCAGLDLREFASDGAGASDPIRALLRAGSHKPVVAAVEGFAIAGGFELVLMCDVVVAARGAAFALPEVTRALVANGGGLLRLPRRIAYPVAAELALTGDPLSAERLYELGLVNRLADPGTAVERAVDLAARIARNPPVAVAATRRVLLGPAAEAWRHQDAIADPVFASAEAREGALAFVQRRPPAWADGM
jgi:enoyl-CoA hydratase